MSSITSALNAAFGPRGGGRVVSVTPRGGPVAPTGPNLNRLLRQLRGDQEEANAAGEAQYEGLMSLLSGVRDRTLGANGLFAQASGLLEGMGETEGRRIGRTEEQALAASEQDLVSRGLGNTTIRETARRGIRSDAQEARSALAERVATSRAGLLERQAGADIGLGGLQGDFMLSRFFQGPDLGRFSALLQSLGQNGGGGSGSGSGR